MSAVAGEILGMYESRLRDPRVVSGDSHESMNKLLLYNRRATGIEYAGQLAIGVVAFVDLDDGLGQQCLPWLIAPEYADTLDDHGGQHSFALKELASYCERMSLVGAGEFDWSDPNFALPAQFLPSQNGEKVTIFASYWKAMSAGTTAYRLMKAFTEDGRHEFFTKKPAIKRRDEVDQPSVVLREGEEIDVNLLITNNPFAILSEPGDLVGAAREIAFFESFVEKHELNHKQALELARAARCAFKRGEQVSYDDLCERIKNHTLNI